MAEKIVIALGGNALQSGKAEPTAEAQLEVVKNTCERIADISCEGYEVGVVHGNGPQVGRILLASETAKDVTPAMPFDVCGAMSQGYIGYHLQQALKYALEKRGRNVPVVTLVTQLVVDPDDPGFQNPTKPIGPFYTEEEAKALQADKGYTMKEDAGRGWRRVVASPIPKKIVEIDSVKQLWPTTIVVHAEAAASRYSRTLTVPSKEQLQLSNKDYAAELLAEQVDADILMILTEVEQVAINFNNARPAEPRFHDICRSREVFRRRSVRTGLHASKGSGRNEVRKGLSRKESHHHFTC